MPVSAQVFPATAAPPPPNAHLPPLHKCKWQACVFRAKIYFCTKGILARPAFCRSHNYQQWWREWWITLYLYAQSNHVQPLRKKKTHRIGIKNRRLRGHKITKWISLSSMGGTPNNQWLISFPLCSGLPGDRLRGCPLNTNRNHLSVPIRCSMIKASARVVLPRGNPVAKKLVIPLFGRWEESNSGLPCKNTGYFSSVQFSHSVVSDSLWPHGLQYSLFFFFF